MVLAYVKAALETAAWLRRRKGTREARQAIHIAISSTLMFWPLYDKTDWSWRLNVLVPAVLATRLLIKVIKLHSLPVKQPNDVFIVVSSHNVPSPLLRIHRVL